MAENLDWHAILAVLDRGSGGGGGGGGGGGSSGGGSSGGSGGGDAAPTRGSETVQAGSNDAPPGNGRAASIERTKSPQARSLAEWAASHTPTPPPPTATPAPAVTAAHGPPGADLLAQALLAQQVYGFGSAEYAAVLQHLAAGATGGSGETGAQAGQSGQAGPSRAPKSTPSTPAPTPATTATTPFTQPSLPTASTSSSGRPPLPPPPTLPETPRASVPGTPAEDAEDKRVRNTLASARFRAKKKAHVESVERNIRALEAQHAELEVDVTDLRKENGLLKDMVQLKYAGTGAGGRR